MIEASFKSYLVSNAGVSIEEANKRYDALEKKEFKSGAVLLEKGAPCRHSFFVEKGLLRSYMLAEDGKEHIIQFAPESWFIVDRSSVYFSETSKSYIEAIEDSKVVLLNDDFFSQVSALYPKFSQFNDRLLHKHILQMQQRINLLLGASAETRYLNFIELYPDLLLRVPQWMIASYLGITPESLSRVRKELANKNFS
ncbi:Crp/Fnr family transcriptional regulator [Aequorivita marina]|uniref:Crp/Fnr family transcriptional regulator n=1 Tax=Aequorivita marina TaxID=3073654 RepID=UPI002874E4C3|nr:Crp/Fnr family transcriptional regulator [Aequorivita sp. S2608]MDS1297790.1 Crp/Fnr family transcriptional regulator [Aequorivita sp. S2608]